ncbi:MAG: hypothetical protein ACR2L3_04450 [Actinomycetota bacterium]
MASPGSPSTSTTAQPAPGGTFRAPPPGPAQTAGAVLAIAFALAAAVLGYKILRGGRGL